MNENERKLERRSWKIWRNRDNFGSENSEFIDFEVFYYHLCVTIIKMRLLTALCARRSSFRVGFVPSEPLDSKIAKYTKDFANLPERYLLRKSRKLYYKSEDHPGMYRTLVLALHCQ